MRHKNIAAHTGCDIFILLISVHFDLKSAGRCCFLCFRPACSFSYSASSCQTTSRHYYYRDSLPKKSESYTKTSEHYLLLNYTIPAVLTIDNSKADAPIFNMLNRINLPYDLPPSVLIAVRNNHSTPIITKNMIIQFSIKLTVKPQPSANDASYAVISVITGITEWTSDSINPKMEYSLAEFTAHNSDSNP